VISDIFAVLVEKRAEYNECLEREKEVRGLRTGRRRIVGSSFDVRMVGS
jgi:hypothetical protein